MAVTQPGPVAAQTPLVRCDTPSTRTSVFAVKHSNNGTAVICSVEPAIESNKPVRLDSRGMHSAITIASTLDGQEYWSHSSAFLRLQTPYAKLTFHIFYAK